MERRLHWIAPSARIEQEMIKYSFTVKEESGVLQNFLAITEVLAITYSYHGIWLETIRINPVSWNLVFN